MSRTLTTIAADKKLVLFFSSLSLLDCGIAVQICGICVKIAPTGNRRMLARRIAACGGPYILL